MHWMVRRSLPDSFNYMRALVRASVVSLQSISEGLTLSEDKGLDLRFTNGAQDVGLRDCFDLLVQNSVPRLTLSKPMRLPPLHVSIAQEEDHSHPLQLSEHPSGLRNGSNPFEV